MDQHLGGVQKSDRYTDPIFIIRGPHKRVSPLCTHTRHFVSNGNFMISGQRMDVDDLKVEPEGQANRSKVNTTQMGNFIQLYPPC